MATVATAERVQKQFVGYLPNDAPPWGAMIGLAFQHVLTMFPATVLVAILTTFDVGVTLFASGLATVVALLISSRLAKSYIPLYYGSSFSYIAPVVAITVTNIYGIDDPVTRIRVAQGGIMMTGLLNVLVGILIRYVGKASLDKVLPPEVTGSVATVIGIALASAALNMAGAHWGVAIITMLATILFSVYLRGRGFIGMVPILLGAVVGYLISIPLGLVDFQPVAEASLFRLPPFTLPIFTFGAILAIAPIAIATIPESTAHLYQISLYVDQLAAELRRPAVKLSRFIGLNLVADGVGDAINGLLGGCAGTNYGENNSLMAITRNYSGPALITAGVIAMLLGFVGKLAALVGTLPLAVTGGLAIYLFGIIGAQGIALQIAQKVNLFDPRKLAVIATILVIGIGGAIGYPGGMIPFNLGTVSWQLPSIATAAVVGILLNLIFMFFPARKIDQEFEELPIEELKLEV
ncbi:MAG TPA: solute carrier family 23 protein [Anaerolineales bacterium]|nr:solute carrier family 23 protein [Anaerolineales bacterium]